MRRLLTAFIFVSLFSGAAFGDAALELSAGLSSPNKGLVGVKFSPMPWSYGFILGSFSNYSDFGVAGSYHFSGYRGFYVFSSHHWLSSDKGYVKNVWEIDTGGGYQYVWRRVLLIYAEIGIPVYIGGGKVYRYYEAGNPYNRVSGGDMVLVSFRTGIGIGYIFALW
jgi:hypothetical protein